MLKEIPHFASTFRPPTTWEEAAQIRADLAARINHIQAQLASKNKEFNDTRAHPHDYHEWRQRAIHALGIAMSHSAQLKAWRVANHHLAPVQSRHVTPSDEIAKSLFEAGRGVVEMIKEREALEEDLRVMSFINERLREEVVRLGGDPDNIEYGENP